MWIRRAITEATGLAWIAPALPVDEASGRIDHKNQRLQNDSAGDLIVMFYHRQRGTETTRDLGIIRVSA